MIDQIALVILGPTAVILAQDHRRNVARWGCVCGLLAQPFWYYTTAAHEQWGLFVVSFFYTFGWARGFYNFWLRRAAT